MNAVLDKILNSNIENLRDFTKEIIEKIALKLSELMKRIYN